MKRWIISPCESVFVINSHSLAIYFIIQVHNKYKDVQKEDGKLI